MEDKAPSCVAVEAALARLEARLDARAYRITQRRVEALGALQERLDAQRGRGAPADGGGKQARASRFEARRSRHAQLARASAQQGQAALLEPPGHVFVQLASLRAAPAHPPPLPPDGWCHVRLALAGGRGRRADGMRRGELVQRAVRRARRGTVCCRRFVGVAARLWSQHFCVPISRWQLPTLCVRAEV